jgi:RNA polymerase sigma-70 factor (ECF subfamily)
VIADPRAASSSRGGVRPDDALVSALRDGDEEVFGELVDALTPSMLRVARCHVPNQAVAEEVVQETWIVVLTRLAGFEGRSSLRTWVFGILLNIARTQGTRERRFLPVDPSGPVDGGPGATAPQDVLMAREMLRRLRAALADLPPRQREVVELHDVMDLSAADVCAVLGLSPGNLRVLLHRGRAKVRLALDDYLRAAG